MRICINYKLSIYLFLFKNCSLYDYKKLKCVTECESCIFLILCKTIVVEYKT